ncbi:MAG: Maf family protein [Candidatus Omnitrophica bacterium]|nr:Maf family protein [Candidatus Omnitrophota bacterium]MDD5487534.1 Maf family protein [Candidatus Omnitrophota bacterium]
MRKIVLASASKRRKNILSECGIRCRVVPSHVPEISGKASGVRKIVIENAKRKTKAVASSMAHGTVVIGADTLVVCGDRLIGKPGNKVEAKRLLLGFSGRRVDVYTGLCVMDTTTGKMASGVERTTIRTVKLNKKDADMFFDILGPYDKAGGFTIEGAGSMLFDDIKGSFFNVLGLPMIKLRELFGKIGEDILEYVER